MPFLKKQEYIHDIMERLGTSCIPGNTFRDVVEGGLNRLELLELSALNALVISIKKGGYEHGKRSRD